MGIALSSFVLMVIFGNRLGDRYPNSTLTHIVKAIDHAIFPDNSTQYEGIYDTALEPYTNNNTEHALTDKPSSMVVFASYTVGDNGTIIPPPDSKKENKSNLKAEKKAKKFEKKKTKLMNLLGKKRMSAAAGLTAGAVLLIILLVIAICAGTCLVVGGFAALFAGDLLGILLIIAGAGIGYLSIKGIGNVKKKDREK